MAIREKQGTRLALWALKVVGVVLFLLILARIDRRELFLYLSNAPIPWVLSAYALLLLSYAAKTARWHLLVESGGLRPALRDSWKLFNAGIFFGAVTPSNTGELGRAVYLRRQGMHGATAVTIIILDRLMDVAAMGLIGIISLGVLFGVQWFWMGVAATCFCLFALLSTWRFSRRLRKSLPWLEFIGSLQRLPFLFGAISATVLCWTLYFCWTILLARSVGIIISIPSLIAALTLTGIVALLPISPSGLGTREAALLFFLAPFGVLPSQAVSLALLIFTLIIFSVLPGLWYWLTGSLEAPPQAEGGIHTPMSSR